MKHHRNPDLIFDEVLLERAERVSKLYHEKSSFELDRVTLFVTHKCNLVCEYCNGPHMDKSMDQELRKQMLSSDVTLKQYTGFLKDWTKHGLQHIHFTGGEATLHPNLADFVSMANENSIASTLTTNGTADIGLYRRLVDSGLSEIRISIDSTIDEEFDNLVGIKGTCKKVKDNIRALADMRDKEKRDLFIILNACVGSFNVDEVKSTMHSLIKLNPDDIKFLIVAEECDYVSSKSSRSIVRELLAYAKSKGHDYELLEKKIHALFRKDTFGLKDPATTHIMKQCFIPLTERTLDARGIYPCSIYLRYKAQPLVDIDSDFEEQQAVIDYFVKNHDCRQDPICIDNCTSCCKQFNKETNKKIRARTALQEAHKRGVISIDRITEQEINKVIETYEKIRNTEPDENPPFMVIKPFGLPYKDEILKHLESQGIVVLKQIPIQDWQRYSLFLYFKDQKSAEHRTARNKAYAEFEPKNSAIYLLLEKGIPEAKLSRLKSELRHWYGEELGFFQYQGERFLLRSNCIHAPNYKDLQKENKVQSFFLRF